MSAAQSTPGPWYWHVDPLTGRVSIRAAHSGQLMVMDFARKGLQAAEPRFSEWPGMFSGEPRGRRGGVLEGAAHWVNPGDLFELNHPDARLIIGAPALLKVVEMLASRGIADKATMDAAQAALTLVKGQP